VAGDSHCIVLSFITVAGDTKTSPEEGVNLQDAVRFVVNPEPDTVNNVPPSIGVVRGEMETTVGELMYVKKTEPPPSYETALLDKEMGTVKASETPGVTQTISVAVTKVAEGATTSPNMQVEEAWKLLPVTVTRVPPRKLPVAGAIERMEIPTVNSKVSSISAGENCCPLAERETVTAPGWWSGVVQMTVVDDSTVAGTRCPASPNSQRVVWRLSKPEPVMVTGVDPVSGPTRG
jgi:hypothetical protein